MTGHPWLYQVTTNQKNLCNFVLGMHSYHIMPQMGSESSSSSILFHKIPNMPLYRQCLTKKSSIFEHKIVTCPKRKHISIVGSFIIAKIMCNIAVALCKPYNTPHTCTLQVTTKIGSACTLQHATANRTSASCSRTSQVMLW